MERKIMISKTSIENLDKSCNFWIGLDIHLLIGLSALANYVLFLIDLIH
jgi:hypothetical protein